MFEGFESLGTPGGHAGPFPILDGAATFNDMLANQLMIAISLYSALTETYVYPYNGNLMGGSVTGWAVIDFTTPVTQFGGYLGTADDLSGGTVTFKDEFGATLDTQSLALTLGQWGWYGWQSDVPIGSIEIKGASTPGLGVTYDDLQLTVPEPASLSLLALGAAALLGTRRARRAGTAALGNRRTGNA